MASSSPIPAAVAKVSAAAPLHAGRRPARVSFHSGKLLLAPSKGCRTCWNRLPIAKAQLNEAVGGSKNDSAPAGAKSEVPTSDGKDDKDAPLSEEAISEFMAQVASLVKLVDSKDIVELQLKQLDCELIIRKKEALPQFQASAPVVMMQQPAQQMVMPSHYPPSPPPVAAAPSPSAASPAQAPPAPSVPKSAKSSHPPLKSPMAGTFYRNPGPGQPPFVKPGDKVKKGQVLCIIEAMKLMNEIEADQSGTVVEILAEDGKPVGVDQPLFVIEP